MPYMYKKFKPVVVQSKAVANQNFYERIELEGDKNTLSKIVKY